MSTDLAVPNTRILEIGGVKVEVNMDEVRIISSFKVGDPVKILIKGYDKYNAYPGLIIGYDAFQKLPTIIVAYVDYNSFKYAHLNENTNDMELIAAGPDVFDVSWEAVALHLDSKIVEAELEVAKAKNSRKAFEKEFKKFKPKKK